MVSLQMIYYIPITYDTYKTYYVLWSHYIIKIIVRLQIHQMNYNMSYSVITNVNI